VIPRFETVLALHASLASLFDLQMFRSEEEIRSGLEEAAALASVDAYAAPAALFYAFARRPQAFRSAWHVMTAELARYSANANGCDLMMADADLLALRRRVQRGAASFEDVRALFEQALRPRVKA
jgi:hypothetical protein